MYYRRSLTAGTSWANEVGIETGTYNTAKVKWGFWADNDSAGNLVTKSPYSRRSPLQLDYVFIDETATPDIWFNSISLVSATWKTKSLKAYVGGSWVAKPLKAYVGGSWVAKSLKSYR